MPWSRTAAASSLDVPSGTGTATAASTTARSAYEPCAAVQATRSPTDTPSTSGPSAATAPAPSTPATWGGGGTPG